MKSFSQLQQDYLLQLEARTCIRQASNDTSVRNISKLNFTTRSNEDIMINSNDLQINLAFAFISVINEINTRSNPGVYSVLIKNIETAHDLSKGLKNLMLNPQLIPTAYKMIFHLAHIPLLVGINKGLSPTNQQMKHQATQLRIIINKFSIFFEGNYTYKTIYEIAKSIIFLALIVNLALINSPKIKDLISFEKTARKGIRSSLLGKFLFLQFKKGFSISIWNKLIDIIFEPIFQMISDTLEILQNNIKDQPMTGKLANITDLIINTEGGPANAIYNRIFFGFKEKLYNIADSPIIKSIFPDIQIANGILFSEIIIAHFARDFWDDIVEAGFRNQNGTNYTHISIAMKIKSVYGDYRNIGKYWAYSSTDKDLLTKALSQWWIKLNAERYHDHAWELQSVIFSYKFLSDKDSILKLRAPTTKIMEPKSIFISSWTNIPMIWNLLELEGVTKHLSKFSILEYYIKGWKLIEKATGNVQPVVLHVINTSKTTRSVHVYEDSADTLSLGYYIEALSVDDQGFEVVSRTYPDGHNISITDSSHIKETAKTVNKQAFMTQLPPADRKTVMNTQIGTYDFESMTTPNSIMDSSGVPQINLSIISASLYMVKPNKDEMIKSWYINDISNYMDSKLLLSNFMNGIISYVTRYNCQDLSLYAHNAAKFDMVFLLETIITNCRPNDSIDILKNNDKYIKITYTINGKLIGKENSNIQKYRIHFMDSYLLLPSSLAKLAKDFGVAAKGDFNVKEVTDKSNFVRIKKDLLAYNQHDCRILYQILRHYAKLNVEEFNVNIFKAPTAAANAFQIFRTAYLDQERDKIALSSKPIYDLIKPAYHGGATDVYIPTNKEGSMLSYYDINSLYPSVMAKYPMPTGNYKIIKDSRLNISDPSLIAFVKCNIICPENILVPLLLQKIDGKSIAGTGTWTGTYYSAELREAINLGYSVEPIEAIIFEGRNIFNKYITDLYAKRLNTPKTDPMNLVYKLTMNSTYGRFGLRPDLSETFILDKEGSKSWSKRSDIQEIREIGNNYVLVTIDKSYNAELDDENPSSNLQISVPIAAAVTALSRVEIHKVKMIAAASGELHYSDTDSIVTSGSIPSELIGPELGLLKLENTAERGVFLAPKVYALHNVKDNGKVLPDIIKAKGLKNISGLTFEVFERLLYKEYLYKSFQPKWFRDFGEGSITIKNLLTTTRITEGKRSLLVDINNKFIGTIPLVFEDGVQISPNVIKIGLPTIILLQIAPPNNLLIEASKTLLIGAPVTSFTIVIALGGPQKYLAITAPTTPLICAPAYTKEDNLSPINITPPATDPVYFIPIDSFVEDLSGIGSQSYEPSDSDFIFEEFEDFDGGITEVSLSELDDSNSPKKPAPPKAKTKSKNVDLNAKAGKAEAKATAKAAQEVARAEAKAAKAAKAAASASSEAKAAAKAARAEARAAEREAEFQEFRKSFTPEQEESHQEYLRIKQITREIAESAKSAGRTEFKDWTPEEKAAWMKAKGYDKKGK